MPVRCGASKYGGIAQLVEHSVHTRSVICSSQIAATRPVGQKVKTPPFHGGNMGSIPVRVTKKKPSFRMVSFFAIRMPEPSHRFSHRPFLTYDSATILRQTAVNPLPVLPHCTKFCRRKSRRVEQENAGWNSRKRCAIICPQAKTACNMMKKKEGLFP